ncbi:hypothetical protein CYY_007794 [Polysphondylium violaceum]|uniref:G domain-containing protein n=1 Tax=Polysphondylium violaceum TaxID=133409 RepID=A0A8J4PNU4_9MYCE|nr:hypothetical protein CYY_007794 [Polysphondylium violaceum]
MAKFTTLFFLFLAIVCLTNTVRCEQDVAVAMYGNPGGGKSTLLSTLMNKPGGFPSGISHVTGLTKTHKSITVDNVIYIDTPGLADAKDRELAAKEIEQSLKTNQRFKPLFVVAPTAGRISSEDMATINVVLKSIPENIKYGIIYNKLSQRMIHNYATNSDHLNSLHQSLARPPHKYLLLKSLEELVDQDNVIPTDQEFNNSLVQFVKEFPENHLPKEQVKPLVSNENEKLAREKEEAHRAELEAQRRAQELLQDQYNNSCVRSETQTEERSSPFERKGPTTKHRQGLKRVYKQDIERGENIESFTRTNCIKGNGQIQYGEWIFTGARQVVTHKETKTSKKWF